MTGSKRVARSDCCLPKDAAAVRAVYLYSSGVQDPKAHPAGRGAWYRYQALLAFWHAVQFSRIGVVADRGPPTAERTLLRGWLPIGCHTVSPCEPRGGCEGDRPRRVGCDRRGKAISPCVSVSSRRSAASARRPCVAGVPGSAPCGAGPETVTGVCRGVNSTVARALPSGCRLATTKGTVTRPAHACPSHRSPLGGARAPRPEFAWIGPRTGLQDAHTRPRAVVGRSSVGVGARRPRTPPAVPSGP